MVMPYGCYDARHLPAQTPPQVGELLPLFADELVHSLRPHIEAHYRTLPGRASTAASLASRGGTQSMFTVSSGTADHFAWASYAS